MPDDNRMDLDSALKEYFGLDAFRNTQRQVVESLLARKDVLTVMPTGGGKSLCYQLPAMLLDGITLVVSPLISLMQDQVDGLSAKGLPATCINSTLSAEQFRSRMAGLSSGQYKLLYVAPERFKSASFMGMLAQHKISLLAIDEAHCISQWGHDFRPDYLRLGPVIQQLGRPPIGAFTATATPHVREDIQKNLGLRDPECFVAGFSRPNLSLNVEFVDKRIEKFSHLRRLIERKRSGIIYCATRKRVDQLAQELESWDISFVSYHGGMSDDARQAAQEAFMSGRVDVAIATNAFGMGVDRSDIRFVAHFEMPGSVEAYYQEVGRAGRDGQDSECYLYYNYADKKVQEFFIEGSNPGRQLIESVYRTLLECVDIDGQAILSIDDLAERVGKGTNPMAVGTTLGILARSQCIERFDVPGMRAKGTRIIDTGRIPSQLPIDYEALREKEQRDFSKLDQVIRFAQSCGCRQTWILKYFGDTHSTPCGRCDECLNQNGADRRPPTEEEMEIVRKALSGVARMSGRGPRGWEARFGKGRIVAMLVGSRSQGIYDANLHQLSTYGILKDYGRTYVNELIDRMEQSGLLVTETVRSFPLTTLSPQGHAVMLHAEGFAMLWPRKAGSRSSTKSSASAPSIEVEGDLDEDLLQKLRDARARIAKRRRNTRLYMVLGNKTLEALARAKPQSIEEAEVLPGIGPVKAKMIIPEFITVIQTHLARQASELAHG